MRLSAVAILVFALPVCAAAFDHTHSQLETVLKKYVRDGRVDYASLKASRGGLDDYLRVAGVVPKGEFQKWNKSEQIAFLVNLYNAATLQVVIDHYPIKSIKDVGTWFKTPWELELVTLFGASTTLDYIEHGLLRTSYAEPRIHFALVCAAKSCPPLRTEPYVATRLEDQFGDQGRQFMRQRESNRVEAKSRTVYLSPIFKWFRADFETSNHSVLSFATPYFPPEAQTALTSRGDWKVKYTHYDWSLNDIRK